jgi:single-strand DNA-binding protein
MINQVVLVGRITKDVELKSTQSNIPVVTFTLAVNRQYSSESGEREADFIQCVTWRKQAENMAKFVHKGDLIGIQGRIQTRQYESEQGTKYITEVVCDNIQYLETKREEEKQDNYNEEQYQQIKRAIEDGGKPHKQIVKEQIKKHETDDDLPF